MKTMDRRIFRFLFFLGSVCIAHESFAVDANQQLGDLDIAPPVIEHAPSESPMATHGLVTLSATVRDNNAVRSVLVFYRNAGEKNYRQLGLSALGADLYQVTLPPEHMVGSELEYYFQSTDSAGNTVLRGTSISPIHVSLQKPDLKAPTQTALVKVEPETPPVATSRSRTWMWWTLGLVAGGAAAYFATQSDSPTPSGDRGTVVK